MCFVEQEDILQMFEGLVRRIFKDVKNIDYTDTIERMSWEDAMWKYGNDKPDIRFDLSLLNLKYPEHFFQGRAKLDHLINKANFKVFDEAETVIAITIPDCSEYSR